MGGLFKNIKSGLIDPLFTKIAGIADFLASPFKNLKASIDPLFTKIGSILEFVASPFKNLWKAIAGEAVTAGDNMFIRVLNVVKELPFVKAIVAIPQHLTSLFDWIPKMVKGLPIVALLEKFLGKELLGKLGGLFKGAKGLAGKAFKGAKGLGGTALDAAAPMLGKLKPSMLLNAAKGFKAIPVLGAIAELGFGGWQTYKDYKKYGAKAALGRAGLTAFNTVTALFDPTGVASAGGSIATNIAMNQAYSRMLDPKDSWKRDNPDIWVQNPNPLTGVMEWNKVEKNKKDKDAQSAVGMPADRTSLDGMMY